MKRGIFAWQEAMEIVTDSLIYQMESKGGISRIFSEILPRLCDLDDSVHITFMTTGKLRQPLPAHARIQERRMPPIPLFLPPARIWRPLRAALMRVIYRQWVGQGNGQIWHSTYYTLPQQWQGKKVVTVADMIFERFPDLFRQWWCDQFREQKRWCIHEADVVICISETTRQDLQRFYGIDSANISVIPLACSDIFRPQEHHREHASSAALPPFLLYVGSRVHYKNFNTVLKAYSRWSKRNEIALTVVGRTWSADEKRRLAELGIRNRVHLLTNVDDEHLCQLYNQALAFVYPSLYEGFGIPLLEAMACGCPVIASRIPSTVEVAGACPIYVEPAEVEALLEAFDQVCAEGRNSDRVRAGLQRVKRYSWDATAKQTLYLYQKLFQNM